MKHWQPTPCPQWAEKIAARHPDDLSPYERLALREHLLSCPACASTYAAYASMEAGIRNLPPVQPRRPLSPGLLYQQQGAKKAHIRPSVVVGFRQTTSQLRPFVAASFRQTTLQLLSLSRGLSHPRTRIAGIANALAAILIVGVIVSGFAWLLAGPRFIIGESVTGNHSSSQAQPFVSLQASRHSSTSVPASPMLTVSPSALSPSDCRPDAHSWTCSLTFSPASGSQGELNWSANSDLPGVTFTPSSGTVAPGQSVQVTISVPNTPPMVVVSPTSFAANTSCTSASDEDWTCIATLANQSGHCPASFSFRGPANTVTVPWNCTATNLSWSADSDLSDVTFTPPSGTLAPGQSVRVTISVPDVTCPATTTFSFEGPGNTVNVPWSCGSVETPTAPGD